MCDEEQEIYIVSKHLPTSYLFMTKGKRRTCKEAPSPDTVTSGWGLQHMNFMVREQDLVHNNYFAPKEGDWGDVMLWFSEVPSSHLLISTPRVASLSSHVPTLYRCFQGSRSQINHMPLNPGHRRCFWGLQTHLVPLPPALNQISSLAGRGAARCHPGRSWGVCCVLAYPPFLLPVFFKGWAHLCNFRIPVWTPDWHWLTRVSFPGNLGLRPRDSGSASQREVMKWELGTPLAVQW